MKWWKLLSFIVLIVVSVFKVIDLIHEVQFIGLLYIIPPKVKAEECKRSVCWRSKESSQGLDPTATSPESKHCDGRLKGLHWNSQGGNEGERVCSRARRCCPGETDQSSATECNSQSSTASVLPRAGGGRWDAVWSLWQDPIGKLQGRLRILEQGPSRANQQQILLLFPFCQQSLGVSSTPRTKLAQSSWVFLLKLIISYSAMVPFQNWKLICKRMVLQLCKGSIINLSLLWQSVTYLMRNLFTLSGLKIEKQ